MKKTFYLFCIFSLSVSLNATVRTVSNNTNSPGQYSDVQTAINASTTGDTLYLQGSPTTYGSFTVNKRLTLVGAGYNVQGTDYNYKTIVDYVSLDTLAIYGPISGIKFLGINLSGYFQYPNGHRGLISNVTIDRCLVNNLYVGGNNWLVKNCYIYSYLDIGNYANLTLSNCFVWSTQIYNTNQASVYFSNNIFLYYTGTEFYNVSYAHFNNNIFYNNTLSTTNSSNSTFNNNLTYNSTALLIPPAGNLGANNISQQNPLFVSTTIPLPGVTGISNYWDVWNYNWALQAGSPGHNAGFDATDVGVYGGQYPWVDFTGMPKLPFVQAMIIKNPVVQKDGTLNINVIGKKHK